MDPAFTSEVMHTIRFYQVPLILDDPQQGEELLKLGSRVFLLGTIDLGKL